MKFKLSMMIITFVAFAATTFGQGFTVYNSIPAPLAGNYPSQPFQAQQASEVGDRVQFSVGSGRDLLTVTQTMSSWGCETGSWSTGDCFTTPGATFSHDVTLNIYEVGPGASVGDLIGTVTQTFDIPYRPSASAVCGDGRWSDGTACFNGYATNITFDASSFPVLPNEVIYSIAYNTSGYGANPIGYTQPCNSTPAGCPYDSLNVALTGVTTVGVNPAPSDAYFNTATAAWYCDGGLGGVSSFRLDQGCWTGFKPMVRFTAANVPTNANQCKKDGWQTRTRANGSTFRNQGDCIQYVNNGH